MKHLFFLLAITYSITCLAQHEGIYEYEVQILDRYAYGENWFRDNILPDTRLPWVLALQDSALKGSIPVYDYDDTTRRLNKYEIENRFNPTDTIIIFDPVTLEEQIVTTHSSSRFTATHLRFREKWTWNDDGKLEKKVLAFALITKHYDEQGNATKERPMFWIKNGPNTVVLPPKITSCIKFYMVLRPRDVAYDTARYNWWSNWFGQTMEVVLDGKTAIYQENDKFPLDLDKQEPLEVKQLLTRIDTVVFFDTTWRPARYNVINRHSYESGDLYGLGFRESWTWTPEYGLTKQVTAICPYVDVKDEIGNIRGWFWSFWLKY